VPSEAFLPTQYGDFRIQVHHEEETGLDHVALVLGSMTGPDAVLVRIHSECLTGDVFGSTRCDCGPQLEAALEAIVAKGWGVLLYLRQEGRGIGLHAKIQAYHLQDEGADTMDANLMLGLPADGRNYAVAVNMLAELGVSSVNLLTNNPEKVSQLKDLGIHVVDRTPLIAGVSEQNRSYLATKVERMGHLINEDEL
jgi:3,4-dihydroxy 2-butanone 4-phosphate synthase/GTP cyclohydrolase II